MVWPSTRINFLFSDWNDNFWEGTWPEHQLWLEPNWRKWTGCGTHFWTRLYRTCEQVTFGPCKVLLWTMHLFDIPVSHIFFWQLLHGRNNASCVFNSVLQFTVSIHQIWVKRQKLLDWHVSVYINVFVQWHAYFFGN